MSDLIPLERLRVGDALPEIERPPLAPADLTAYAAASGDHNPLHLDQEAARAAGFAAPIAHGMLVMGLLGRLADCLAGPAGRRELAVRFRAPTALGEGLRCGGQIAAIYERGGEGLVEAELWARGAGGELKASGRLVVALPRRGDEAGRRGPAESSERP